MEITKKNCSFEEHKETDAIIYCVRCQIYMCNKCENLHSKLFKNHQIFSLDKDIKDIFTGFCNEKEHFQKLDFFCKNHNQLCCAFCISKIKTDNIGNHKDCEVCKIEDVKTEKMSKLKENIKKLEELSNDLQESIDKLKIIFETINESKETIKNDIQKIFTKLRNELNNREDEILLEIENKYNELYFAQDIIKSGEKLPSKIKLSLKKGKLIEKEEGNNNLSSFINDCIMIENNIKDINIINENIKKCNNKNDIKIKFIPEEEGVHNFIENIKKFGKLNIYDKKLLEATSILNNDIDKQKSILYWIKEKTNKDYIKFELIFKMSENGSKGEDFHKYCDNKGPTLTLIKTTKNKIFGGFSPLSWKNKGGNQYDKSNQTFIFSLDLLKKYDMTNINKNSVRFNSGGPVFGDNDIKILENMKQGNSFANINCNFLSNGNLELIGGKGNSGNFEIEELEVYRAIY